MKNVKQGYFIPKYPNKYKGNLNNIYYRSSWEKKFLNYCDKRQNIMAYALEEIAIPYISPIDHKWHSYYVDFWIKFKDEKNKIRQKIIEIKPYKQIHKPKKTYKRQHYLKEMKTFSINQAKWKAAKKFAKKHNMEFQILTEHELFGIVGK